MKTRSFALVLAVGMFAAACGGGAGDSVLTIYSGRSEELVGPIVERFEQETGIEVEVRYAGSSELAAAILEEGETSPADVFFAQDPASVGSVAIAGLFQPLPEETLGRVPEALSDSEGRWVGVSGRARVFVYDTTVMDPADLPADENELTAPEWSGRVAVAPTNGSFQAFVAAKILLDGEAATLTWLEGIAANEAPTYPKNSAIVAAVDEGQVESGLVNHYYLFRRIAENGDAVAANAFFSGGTAGSLVMPAGVGILATADSPDEAQQFVDFLLSEETQEYFATETFEYPLIDGVPADPRLVPLDQIVTPAIDLSELANVLDLAADLIARAGLL